MTPITRLLHDTTLNLVKGKMFQSKIMKARYNLLYSILNYKYYKYHLIVHVSSLSWVK